MKLLTKVALVSAVVLSSAQACSEIFINKGGKHVIGRNLELPINVASENAFGYIGQKHKALILLAGDSTVKVDTRIPDNRLKTWTTKYGHVGRVISHNVFPDGMNTQGVSIATLMLVGTEYPEYNPKDKRDVIGLGDLGTYILSVASSTKEALELLKELQFVKSAVQFSPYEEFTYIPQHISVRDKSGHSAVIEFIGGKTIIHDNAKDILTNQPTYDWQLKNAAKYSSLNHIHTKPNKEFKNRVIDYMTIFNTPGLHDQQSQMLGLPGDFTPMSRFVRGTIFLENMMIPKSSMEARGLARALTDSLAVIPVSIKDLVIWQTVKDLDNNLYYDKSLFMFTGKNGLYANDITQGFNLINLNDIDFSVIPADQPKTFNMQK